MQDKKTLPPNKIGLYVAILAALIVVLIFTLIKQGPIPTTQPSLTSRDSGENKQGQNSTAPTTISTSPRGTGVIVPTKEAVYEDTQIPENTLTNNNEKNSNAKNNNSYAQLGCSAELGTPCVIKKDDEIFSVLGQDPNTELLVNGVKIKPDKIIYKTSSETYKDEQMKDGQGKVLTSTNKKYDSDTKTLTISIGASSSYYSNLKPTEQRLLYLSQTVRSFMAMFGKTPENFVKVEKAVNELSSWQPTP